MGSESRLSSSIFSKHFKPEYLARRLDFQEENGILLIPWFKRDRITAFPSIRVAVVASEKLWRNSSQLVEPERDRTENAKIFY